MKVNLDQYLSRQGKTGVVFDLDGTVAKLRIDWTDEYRRQLRQVLRKVNKDEADKYVLKLGVATRMVYEMQKKHGQKVKKLVDRFEEEWEVSHYHGIRANQRLVKWIKNNSRRYRLYLWTSNSRKMVERVLRDLDLTSQWQMTVTADEVKNIKPDDDGFRLIRQTGMEKTAGVFIGDSQWDELAAEKAGLDFIKVSDLRWAR